MTNEEAKKYLSECEGCKYMGKGKCNDDGEKCYNAKLLAIEALKRQLPMKPKMFESSPEKIYLCAKCGSTFIRNKWSPMAYCPNCGQKQLWEE